MTILECAAALRSGQVSSIELTRQSLARIQHLDGGINAFVTVTQDHALAQAEAADRELREGHDRGPLHGVPYALKDNFATKGIRTTCGSLLFKDHVPGHDSAVTQKFAEAGAVLIGKTGLHELAYGITSNNPHFGPVRNPRETSRVPGGSSGGSAAAVAAGMAPIAMGTDTGGSIRLPAAFCGVVGIKPTFGRVSRHGVLPLDFSLDHMGPLTATVRDAAVVLEIIAGYDKRDDTSSQRLAGTYQPPPNPAIRGLRIGRPENFFLERLQPEVSAAYETALKTAERLGAEIVPVPMPDIASINIVGRLILMSEATAAMAPFLHRRDQFGSDVLALLDQGRLLAAPDYVNAQRLRRQMQREFASVWKHADLLLTPTSPIVAPEIGAATVQIDGVAEDTRLASTRFVRPFNVLGLPALSLPCGTGEARLPIGLQLVGRAFDEARIFLAAACLEAAV